MTRLIVAFRNFVKAPENQLSRNKAIRRTWPENGMKYHRKEGNEEEEEEEEEDDVVMMMMMIMIMMTRTVTTCRQTDP